MLIETVSNNSLGTELLILQSIEFDPLIAVIAFLGFLAASSVAYTVRSRGEDGWATEDLNEDQSDALNLIMNEGGEVKQKTVSNRLDWSDAKTSRITSELTDIGAVSKVRKDRQNYLQVNEENRRDS